MTFWELVEGRTFYWQMFTLSKGRQILTVGRTKRRPMLMPSGAVYTRQLNVPADLPMYTVGKDLDTWTASFAGITLTIRMLKEVEVLVELVMVKFFCSKCGEKMWEMTNWNTARCYSQDDLHVLLVCTDCTLEEIRADKRKEASK